MIFTHVVNVPTSLTTFRGILIGVIFRPGICKNIFLCWVLHWRIIRIKRSFSGVHAYVYVPMHSHTLNKRPFIQFMSESAPCTHAWTPEKNRLILYCTCRHDLRSDAVVNEIYVVLEFFDLGMKIQDFIHFNKTKQSSYYLNLFHESIYFRIYVGFPHPGLNVNIQHF